MRAAIVEEGIVVNVIEVESLDFLPGLVLADGCGNIGDYWSDGEFICASDPNHPKYASPEPV